MGGPFTQTIANQSGTFYLKKVWSTQARPYLAPLPFSYSRGVTLVKNVGQSGPAQGAISPFGSTSWDEDLRSRCAKKFYGKLSDPALWSTNLYEGRQSINMIADRARQLTRALVAVKRFEFGKAAKILGLRRPPKGVSRSKQVANNWLEFHFGWAPLFEDVHRSCEVLSAPPLFSRVRSRSWTAKSNKTKYGDFPNVNYSYTLEVQRVSVIKTGARVGISNSDMYLASQLGLVNPALFAWEAVPFSFVVDWVIPIGDFLGSLTATYGLDVRDGWTTQFTNNLRIYQTKMPSSTTPVQMDKDYGIQIDRLKGYLGPTAILRPKFALSPTRAFTSWALFVQQLKSVRR